MGSNRKKFKEKPTLNKIATSEWTAVGCNGRTLEELPTPTKLRCKNWLEWAAMGGNLLNFSPDLNFDVSAVCNGMQGDGI